MKFSLVKENLTDILTTNNVQIVKNSYRFENVIIGNKVTKIEKKNSLKKNQNKTLGNEFNSVYQKESLKKDRLNFDKTYSKKNYKCNLCKKNGMTSTDHSRSSSSLCPFKKDSYDFIKYSPKKK